MKLTLALAGGLALLVASAIHPFGNVKRQNGADPPFAGAPGARLLERACFNCHSEKTAWPWYSRVAPVSWLIERDVANGRGHLNLSRWNEYSADERRDRLAQIGVMVRTQRMPPAPYAALHPEAKLTAEEIEILYRWARAERAGVQ